MPIILRGSGPELWTVFELATDLFNDVSPFLRKMLSLADVDLLMNVRYIIDLFTDYLFI